MIGVLGATGRVGRHVAAGLAERRRRGARARPPPRPRSSPLPAVQADLTAPATLRGGPRRRRAAAAAHRPRARPGAARGRGDRRRRRRRRAADREDLRRRADARPERHHRDRASRTGAASSASSARAWTSRSCGRRSTCRTCSTPSRPASRRAACSRAPFGHAPIAMVDVRDVADCAIAALLDERPEPARLAAHRPAPASRFDAIAEHLGARYVSVPAKLAARTLRRRGLGAAEIEHATRMAAYFAAGADGTATDHVAAPHRPRAALDRGLPRRASRARSRPPLASPAPCPATKEVS